MKNSTPYVRLVVELALAAALLELVIMQVLPLSMPGISGWQETVAAAILLMLTLAPVAWWRSVRAFQRLEQELSPTTVALNAADSMGLSAFVLLTGTLLSLWAGQRIGTAMEAQALERFDRLTARIEGSVRQRFALPLFGLRGAHGTHNASQQLDRHEFQSYVQSIRMDEQYPGVRGFGYIVKVARQDLDAFERVERADDAASFRVRTSGQAPDLYVIKMIEPMTVNGAALGLDVGSEPVRREGILRAIDTGQPTMTGPIKLLQDTRQRPGVLFFLPLYHGSTPPSNPKQRREKLVGIYYAPIVIAELMDGLFDTGEQQLDIVLEDTTETRPAPLFTASGAPGGDELRRFDQVRRLSIAGRSYVLKTQANAAFASAWNRSTASWVVMGGTLLSALLALATWMLASARARTEAHAALLTIDLDRLAQVARLTSNSVVITNENMQITWVNEGFTRLYGYTFEEARGRTMRELVATDECPPESLATLDATLALGNNCRIELLNRNKAGDTFWIDTEIQPRRDAEGALLGYIEISQNISMLKETSRRLESAQRETHALLKILNEHAIISIADTSGRLIEVNEAFCTLTGYTREELLGNNPKLINSGTHSQAFWNDMWRMITSGRTWSGEICNRSKSGQLYWVDTIIAPWVDDQGQIEKFIAIRHDVTSRKLTEQQLRSSEAFLERASRIAGVGGWQVDLHTMELAWSDQACAILGLPPGHKEHAQAGLSRITPVSQDSLIEALQANRLDRQPVDLELEAITATQHPIWLRLVAEWEEAQDATIRLVGAIQDITERRANQARLRETSTLLTSVLHAASEVAVVAVDTDMVIRVFNTGAERLLQYSASEVVGQATSLLFREPIFLATQRNKLRERYGGIEPSPHQLLIDASTMGQVRQIDYRRRDGHMVPVSIVVTEMRDDSGRVTGYLGIARDRTQDLAYETSLQQAKQSAEQASAAKGQFLANMSHEIRTPMNAILGMLQLLQKTPLDGRQRDYTSKAERAAQSLLVLINDILDFSKIEANKMILHERPFALARLLEDLDVVLSANLGERPVQLRLSLDPALPTYLLGDDLRLLQVLINLGGNAIKFTHQGHVNVSLDMLSQDDGKVGLRISVQDTGIGIASQALAHIFEGFSQAEGSTTRKYGGTGLGLAISRNLVSLMGGQLQVRSEPGQGSTFWFDISLARVQADDTLPSSAFAPLSDASAPAPRLAGWRLLLVEDNPNNRQVAHELLTDEGAEVSMAHNGAEGVQAVLNAPDLIDAVLMDVQMPVMDGLTATRSLRETLGDAAPPIIAMTANALPEDLVACQAAGMVAHVGKPFDLENLIATVRQHGRQHRHHRADTGPPSRNAALHTHSDLPPAVRQLAQAQGIALDPALARLGHRQDIYQRLLTQFGQELPDAANEAHQLWQGGHGQALRAWLHTFKGLAGTLGLTTLQSLASNAEQACPEANQAQETSAVEPAWLQALLDAMRQSCEPLRTLAEALPSALPHPDALAAPAQQAAAASAVTLRPPLEELIKLLQHSDMGALDVHAQFQATHGAALAKDDLAPLNDAMARLDFASAVVHCQQLLARCPQE